MKAVISITRSHFLQLLTFLVMVLMASPTWALDCAPEASFLNSQAEINDFQSLYGGGGICDTIAGGLHIEGDDIVSLSALSDLVVIGGVLDVRNNPLLSSLDGLSGITSVGKECDKHHLLCPSVFLKNNSALANIDGLSGLTNMDGDLEVIENPQLTNLDGLNGITLIRGSLQIHENEALANIDGLSSLTEVGSNISGSLVIHKNPSLANLDGLISLKRVDSLYLSSNDSLTNVDGLANLTDPGHSIDVASNAALMDLDGLSGLSGEIESLELLYLPALTSLHGLAGLTGISSTLRIGENASLTNFDGLEGLTNIDSLGIHGNTMLSDLSALSNVTDVPGYVGISRNPMLSTLKGLSNIIYAGDLLITTNSSLVDVSALSSITGVGGSIRLESNQQLADCSALTALVDPIDDGEPGPGPGPGGVPDVGLMVDIGNNLPGCNSINEILGNDPLLEINAGLNDAWFNLETNGQGFLITVFPEIKQMFMAWFTYDTERPPEDVTAILGEPGHRWLTAQGEYVENYAELTLYVTTGGVFDSEEPTPGTEPYGEILLEFSTCNAGTVTYDIPSIFQMGIVPIERITLDNVPLCYMLDKQPLDSNPAVR